jgi:hypothetical protein
MRARDEAKELDNRVRAQGHESAHLRLHIRIAQIQDAYEAVTIARI